MLPKGITIWELRGKHGRKHVVFYRFLVPDDGGVSLREYPRGQCRWYYRRRGQRWQPFSDWFTYYPESVTKSDRTLSEQNT